MSNNQRTRVLCLKNGNNGFNIMEQIEMQRRKQSRSKIRVLHNKFGKYGNTLYNDQRFKQGNFCHSI